jgi:hypothetical protein
VDAPGIVSQSSTMPSRYDRFVSVMLGRYAQPRYAAALVE